MKSKLTIAIIACCTGLGIGWLMRSGQPPREAAMEGERPREPSMEGERPREPNVPASVNNRTPPPIRDDDESPAWRASVPASRDDEQDTDDDRMAQHGIIMQQSADETRQAIIGNANLDDAQIERLDNIIASMNRQMLEVSTKWADHIRETGTLDINTRLKMQHEISGVMVSVSDTMDTEFPGWRASAPESRNTDTDLSRLIRVTTAFEPFRKIRSEILRGEIHPQNQNDGNQE